MSHIHDLIDFTVEVFIVHKNKVLLRKHDKYKVWLSIGGHIELNEDPNEATIREVKEEVGLDIELIPTSLIPDTDKEKYEHLIVPIFMNRHKINEKHEHITLVYFAKSSSKDIQQGEKEISEDCRWFSLEDLENLEENISKTVKNYAKTAINILKEKNENK